MKRRMHFSGKTSEGNRSATEFVSLAGEKAVNARNTKNTLHNFQQKSQNRGHSEIAIFWKLLRFRMGKNEKRL